MSNLCCRFVLLLFGSIGMCGSVLMSSANENTARLAVKLSEEFNDNVQLVPNPDGNVLLTTLSTSGEFTSRKETMTALVRAQVNANRYRGASALNGTDIILGGSLDKEYERDAIGLAVDYVRDSTRASELTQTGLVQANRQRGRKGLKPKWTRNLTERAKLSLGYEFTDVRYKDAAQTSLTDYRTWNTFSALEYQYTEQTTLRSEGGWLDLKSATGNGRIRTQYFRTGVIHALDARTKVEFSVGGRRTSNPVVGGRDNSNGWLASIGFEREHETGRFKFGTSREINPAGSGELTQTDKLYATIIGAISERLSWGLEGAIYRNATDASNASASRDTYYKVGANLYFALTQKWTADLRVGRAKQDPQGGASAAANSIYIGLRYEMPL